MCVVIIRGTHEELNSLRVSGIKACIFFDVLTDCSTNTLVIKSSIVGNCVRVHQQTVVSDDRNTSFFRLSLYVYQSVRVDGSDNQAVYAGCNHVLDLGNLCLHVVLCILKVYFIAKSLKLSLHVSAVVDPSLGRLGRHCHANLLAAGCLCCCRRLIYCRVSRVSRICRICRRSCPLRCGSSLFCSRRSCCFFSRTATAYEHGSNHCYAQKCA